jgi:hypothetical protein
MEHIKSHIKLIHWPPIEERSLTRTVLSWGKTNIKKCASSEMCFSSLIPLSVFTTSRVYVKNPAVCYNSDGSFIASLLCSQCADI